VKRPGQIGVIQKSYKTPGKLHEDYAALEILANLLGSGASSLLNKDFVDKGLAIGANAGLSAFKEVGLLSMQLSLPIETDHRALDQRLERLVDSVTTMEFAQTDIDRIKAKIINQSILYKDGSGTISSMLNEAIAVGDWKDYINAGEKIKGVGKADLERVAKKYLLDDQSTTGYFIPVNQGGQTSVGMNGQRFVNETMSAPNYFRSPFMEASEIVLGKEEYGNGSPSDKRGTEIQRSSIEGIDVISLQTTAKGFVTVTGSMFQGGGAQSNREQMVQGLTVEMLSRGTQKKSKIVFSEALEKRGASINISSNNGYTYFSFKCLKEDLGEVMALFAEELRLPLFDSQEFENLKKQFVGYIGQEKTDPSQQGRLSLLRRIYKEGHPNYPMGPDQRLALLDEIELNELKEYHQKYFGPASMRLVFVGDIDQKSLETGIKSNFSNWNGGMPQQELKKATNLVHTASASNEIVYIPEKSSADLLIGQYTGLANTDKEFFAFYLANSALGSGFSGRLMKTVRDNEGLTYGIGSGHGGDQFMDGYWYVNGTFNPTLIAKGETSALREIKKWHDEGLDKQELEDIKSYRIGSYKVGLSSTQGLANSILSFVNQGKSPDYIYQYPLELDRPNLKEVNGSIKKFVDPNKLNIVKSGTLQAEQK
jgi:zinc protease